MEPSMWLRAGVGIVIILVAAVFALKRAWFLFQLIRSGQPAVGRTSDPGVRLEAEATKSRARRNCSSGPSRASLTCSSSSASLILGLTVIEAVFELFIHGFAFPSSAPGP